ncbi:carbohydrate-binding protein [Catellatospora chokoriensis]|uniref:Carbohydrate-binding protein n=1 Tax=Catellatospora chokoriensis TaxID=310353 RepID=A0A8J3K467_9ACTN|nr:carbohydrate-binding protein [Catellatospora chokoriensis]GIF92107.1 hypothetical protein Cch02nite_55510 [Catellatospora chokoriensis]
MRTPRFAVLTVAMTVLIGLSAVPAASAAPDSEVRQVSGALRGAAAVAAAGDAADAFRDATTLRRQSAQNMTAAAAQLHNWWGVFPSATWTGMTATHTLNPNFRLSNAADYLYSPTMKPPHGSCIEVVTVHTRTYAQVWAWNWCGPGAPAVTMNINSTFLAKYATTVNGRQAYTVRIRQTNAATNTWTATLYNYSTAAWDTMYTSSGTDRSGWQQGWDMFEFYSNTNPAGRTYICDDIAAAGVAFEGSSITVLSGSTWIPAGTGNSTWMPSASPNPSAYKCPALSFNILHANDNWLVHE